MTTKESTPLISYHADPALKAALVIEIGKHEQADQIIKGTYGSINGQWRGCAIGCSLRSLNIMKQQTDPNRRTGDHDRFPKELGWPLWLAHIEDTIFENLPDALAKTWPRRIAEAIPVGAVIDEMVLAKILRWMLADTEFGVRYATDDETIRGHIDGVIAGFDAELSTGGHATDEQREAAARAAMAANDDDSLAAWSAFSAWSAWDATSLPPWKKADPFFSALSEFLLALLRALPTCEVMSQKRLHL